MMRILPALAAPFALLICAPVAAAPRDWTAVAAPARAPGAFTIGNPAARVRLIEYVSYTCPHCRHFAEESAPVLKDRLIRSGAVSLEVRSMIHDKLDLVAATLARCSGPRVFPRLHAALFARQTEWVERGVAFDNGQTPDPTANPAGVLRALAEGSGLAAIAREAGMTPAAVNACFADLSAVNAVIAAARAMRTDVRGTPSFEINGELVGSMVWADLEPKLRAAIAR